MHLPLFYGLVVCWLAVATPAAAYERASVDDAGEIYLYWPVRDIAYYIDQRGSEDVPINDLVAAVKRAFRRWDSVECTDLNARYEGLIDQRETSLVLPKTDPPDRRNVVVWHHDIWPPKDASVVALTTLVFDARTGQIIDADIDVNGVDYTWAVADGPLPPGLTDVENVITHEAGHVFGLGHSDEPEATMWPIVPPGETSKRDLHPDDVAGICAIYPFGQPTPLGRLQLPSRQLIGGCRVGGGRFVLPAVLLPLVLWAGLAYRVHRRRRQRTR